MTASTYIAGDLRVAGVPIPEIAALLRVLVDELRQCRTVTCAKDAALWVNSIGENQGRKRRVVNEIGKKWRGRLKHYDVLEASILAKCLVITEAEMAGLFSESR